jgi:perosamine synthetase
MTFIPVCEPTLEGNELLYIKDCVETGWISSTGKYVKLFEDSFAEFTSSKYAIGVTNGTVAIHLALIAVGIKKGDEVIIPSFTMAATAFAISYIGAIPIIVDVEKDTWNLNLNQVEKSITKKTKAILCVSIFGNPCDYDGLNYLKNKYNLIIIEDAAESHGSSYKTIPTGALADITTFSFFANKNITTGEGGMVTTNNIEYYNNCKYYKNLCFSLTEPRNYLHNNIGFNYRISNLHSAIGLAQLEKSTYYIQKRITNYQTFKSILEKTSKIIFQKETQDGKRANWMNSILLTPEYTEIDRDNILSNLRKLEIDSRIFFKGMHTQPALKNQIKYSKIKEFPVTNYLSTNGFYLPSSTNLTTEQIEYISNNLITLL